MLSPGDLIFHPTQGFGTISGLGYRDPLYPIQDVVAIQGASDQAQDYSDIELTRGGTLLVPEGRAERAGLRLLTNGVDASKICLLSPAFSWPLCARKRAAELTARGRIGEPTALAASVRDMVAHSHGRSLTASEKSRLDKLCERLTTEAALADRIPRSQARAAIREAVDQTSGR